LDAGNPSAAADRVYLSLKQARTDHDPEGQLKAYQALAEIFKQQVALAAPTNMQEAQGFATRAIQTANEGLGIAQKTGFDEVLAQQYFYQVHWIMAEAYLAIGELSKAENELDKADRLAKVEEIGLTPDAKGEAERVRALLDWQQNHLPEALKRLDQVREILVRQQLNGKVIRVDIERARIQLMLGEADPARAILQTASDLADRLGRDYDKIEITRLLQESETTFGSNQTGPSTSKLSQPASTTVQPDESTDTMMRRVLVQRFSFEELRTLCTDLRVNFNDLAGEGQEAKARELIAYLERRERLGELLKYIRQHRPDIKL
jgi:tetratricopeptide (TPR) repeat protein